MRRSEPVFDWAWRAELDAALQAWTAHLADRHDAARYARQALRHAQLAVAILEAVVKLMEEER